MRLCRAILPEKECVVPIGAAINSEEIPRFYAYQFFCICLYLTVFAVTFSLSRNLLLPMAKKNVSPAK